MGDGLLDLVLMKILHQSQHLNELAASGIAHPGFHQPPQTMDAFCELLAVQRGGLIESPALVFQQGQIVQGIVDKIGGAVSRDDIEGSDCFRPKKALCGGKSGTPGQHPAPFRPRIRIRQKPAKAERAAGLTWASVVSGMETVTLVSSCAPQTF